MNRRPSRPALALWFIIATCLSASAEPATQPAQPRFCNPIAEGADPWVIRHNGHYYWCLSGPQRSIEVWRSDSLTSLGTRHIVYRAPAKGPHSGQLWAPELHRVDGKWYIYVAASDGRNENHRMIVLESAAAKPLGPFKFKAELYTGDNPDLRADNRWAIDATLLEHNGRRYVIWSGWPDTRDVQYLYIAPPENPWTVAGPRVCLCNNSDHQWEHVRDDLRERGLNEAPQALQHGDRTFVIFSCAGGWEPNYKLALLELQPGGNPLRPQDWNKHPKPVFARNTATFGVGHCCFVQSPDGREPWFLYHAKADPEDGWRRAIFAQPLHFDARGFPTFGEPDAWGHARPRPSGEDVTRRLQIADDFNRRLVGWAYAGDGQYPPRRRGRLHLGHRYDAAAGGDSSPEALLSREFHAADLRVRAQVCLAAGAGSAGIILHAGGCGPKGVRGYYVGLCPAAKRVHLAALHGQRDTRIAEAPCHLEHGRAYELAVTCHGDQINVTVAGEPVLTARHSRFEAGSVGLRVIGGHAWFDDLDACGGE
jgi:GH43 family beta-xylosidase